jgi:ribosomal protein S18 acetylase RimI-like enzyme
LPTAATESHLASPVGPRGIGKIITTVRLANWAASRRDHSERSPPRPIEPSVGASCEGNVSGAGESGRGPLLRRSRTERVHLVCRSRATPSDAVDALTSLGALVVGDCTAMVLDHEPPQMAGVEVHQVTTPEQLLIYRRIGVTAEVGGDLSTAQKTELHTTNDAAWQDYTSYAGRRLNFLAYLDSEPVTAAGLLLTDHGLAVLSGAATLPSARGRGLYRALVHARWLVAQRMNAGPAANGLVIYTRLAGE